MFDLLRVPLFIPPGYFDERGASMKRFFLKSPVVAPVASPD
jgi:hypothetical protein